MIGPFVLLVLVAFVAMEPVTYAAHRWVMHGVGIVLHRSHHLRWPERRPDDGVFELNDAYPVLFAGLVNLGLAAAFNIDGLWAVFPVALGVTAYGAAYAFVHDIHIHRRLPIRVRSTTRIGAWLDRLAAAHALHHRFGGEPYGMLVPVVPASVRAKADRSDARRAERYSGAAQPETPSAGSAERTPAAPRP